jgi:carboxyl-terminal processing protease
LGIAPDVVFELSEAQRKELQQDRTKVGTPADPQYVKAVDVLKQKIAATRENRAAAPAR